MKRRHKLERPSRACSRADYAMSCKEIGAALGITPRGVEGILARALAKMRVRLEATPEWEQGTTGERR